MKPIEFKEQNTVFAKDQPEYVPLPAYTDKKQTISLWQMTWPERMLVLLCGKLWLRQLNFDEPLQPQLPQVVSPFKDLGK